MNESGGSADAASSPPSSASPSASAAAGAGAGQRFIVFGDVHGCLAELQELVARVGLRKGGLDVFVSVGDLVDKGPDSPGVVKYMRRLREEGYEVVLVQGNHEAKHQRARAGKGEPNAGVAAIIAALLPEDVKFLDSAVLYHRIPEHNVFVVHAGIPPLVEGPLPPPTGELAGPLRAWDQMLRIRTVRGIERRVYSVSVSVYGLEEDVGGRMAEFLASPAALAAAGRVEVKCAPKSAVRPVGAMVPLGEEEEGDESWAVRYDGRHGHVLFGHVPYADRDAPLEYAHATALDLCCVSGNYLCAAVLEAGRPGERAYVTVKAHKVYLEREMAAE